MKGYGENRSVLECNSRERNRWTQRFEGWQKGGYLQLKSSLFHQPRQHNTMPNCSVQIFHQKFYTIYPSEYSVFDIALSTNCFCHRQMVSRNREGWTVSHQLGSVTWPARDKINSLSDWNCKTPRSTCRYEVEDCTGRWVAKHRILLINSLNGTVHNNSRDSLFFYWLVGLFNELSSHYMNQSIETIKRNKNSSGCASSETNSTSNTPRLLKNSLQS